MPNKRFCVATWRILALSTLLTGLASIVLWPPFTYGSKNSCALTVRQKSAAVRAFKGLAPIFQEPRCLNCHGAVNPFSGSGGHGGGHIDIREEARRFLERPDLRSSLAVRDDPTDALAAKAIAGIREIADSRFEISDNDLIRRKGFEPMREACKECHVSSWIIPLRHNHFVNRSWKEMCVHMKTSSLTNSPDVFLRHMQDDELVLEGFKGRRGLLEPPAAEPPTLSIATVAKYANDWVAAMGSRFHQPPECGCESEGILLEVEHRLHMDPSSSRAKLGAAQFDGTARFDVLLSAEGMPEGWYRGEASVMRPLVVRHVTPSFWKCSGSGSRTEDWQITAELDTTTSSMQVRFEFDSLDEKAAWTCREPGGTTITDELRVDIFGELASVVMPASSGASGHASGAGTVIESISLKVIDSPVGP